MSIFAFARFSAIKSQYINFVHGRKKAGIKSYLLYQPIFEIN